MRLQIFHSSLILLVMVLIISACAPAPQPRSATDSQPAVADENNAGALPEVVEQDGEVMVGADAEAGQTEPEAVSDSPFARVPANVPIMDGAYDVKVSGSGLQVNYKIGGSVNEVVEFYQTRLAELGWESAGPPDTAVGSTALMLRKNAENNRLSINLQYNPNGLFTVVSLVVTR